MNDTANDLCTMRFVTTAKVLAEYKLKYYRISECCMGMAAYQIWAEDLRSQADTFPPRESMYSQLRFA